MVVGELNPYGVSPEMALFYKPDHASGARLMRIVGLRAHTYSYLDKRNLCVGRWSMPVARAAAEEILGEGPACVVTLGRKVADAFGYRGGLFAVDRRRDTAVVAIPHPSGLCREWNRPGAQEAVRTLLRAHAPSVPWGEVTGDV